jgi:hypothetical protein
MRNKKERREHKERTLMSDGQYIELQTAIEILEYYQEWRLGKREDIIHEPKKLTEAIDAVLSEVKKHANTKHGQ